jgi:[ribosomal protein S18]-alanine N-acetyltransferase
MQVNLRPYTPADFETLFTIDQACYPRGIAYSRRTLRELLSEPGAECVVAEIGAENVLAGFLIAESEGDRGHIVTLDVVEEHRRFGIGTVLLDAAERRLQSIGVRNVFLETATNNTAGVAFWKRHGYHTVGLAPRYYLGRVDAHLMRKDLTEASPDARPRERAGDNN